MITPQRRLSDAQMSFLGSALSASGCYNFNITGGEPLLLPLDYLGSTIRVLNGVPGVAQVWITTNGQRLNDRQVLHTLREAGLRSLAVSIGAHTDAGYLAYTGGDMDLTTMLKGVQSAVELGLEPRVHVPLHPAGIEAADDLLELVEKVRRAGVRELSYFALNSGGVIERDFASLYRDPRLITEALLKNSAWRLEAQPDRRPFFTDGEFKIFFPRPVISLMTENCRSRNCGPHCQGVYAVYLVLNQYGWAFRACHRQFEDENNVYPIKDEWFTGEDYAALASLLEKVWGYAYGDGR